MSAPYAAGDEYCCAAPTRGLSFGNAAPRGLRLNRRRQRHAGIAITVDIYDPDPRQWLELIER